MYKHCTTEESVHRQRQLELCLMGLMREVSYSHITIGDICQQAGISRKSFYRYFGSKEDCLCALVDHCIMDGASTYLPDLTGKNRSLAIYERFFEYWKQLDPLLDALRKNELNTFLAERMLQYLNDEELAHMKHTGTLVHDTREYLVFVVSGILGLVFDWHRSGYQKSVSEMAAALAKII